MDARTEQLISHCFKQKGGVKEEALHELFGDIFGGNMSEFCDALKGFFTKKEEAKEEKVDAEAETKSEKKSKSSPGGKNPKVKAELEEEVEVAVKAAKEAGKRVTRATKPYVSGLKDALTNVGISCDDEKVFKKHWDKFRGYVNDMPEDDYKKHPNLTDHMRDFANLMKGESEEKKDEAVAEAEKPKKGGRKKAVKAEAEKKVEAVAEDEKPKKGGRKKAVKADDKKPEAATGGGAAQVKPVFITQEDFEERLPRLAEDSSHENMYWDPETGEMVMAINVLSHAELVKRKMFLEETDKVGIFLDTKSNTAVTGPKEDGDDKDDGPEDDVVKFDGNTYNVSPDTGRVYEEDDEGLHVFVGFKGVGKFKEMK